MKSSFHILIVAVVCFEMRACMSIPNTMPTSNNMSTATSHIELPQEIVDYSTQETIILKSKFDKLYSYNQQVIDNYLSLSIEELNPKCHERGDVATIKFIFRNLSQSSLTISNRFALSPSSTSYYVGADLTPIFYEETGEQIHPSGDFLFIEYIPEINTLVELSARENLETSLEVFIPNKIWKEEENDMIYFPADYYLLKFIYWSAEVDRAADYEFSFQKRAVSSNTITICIK